MKYSPRIILSLLTAIVILWSSLTGTAIATAVPMTTAATPSTTQPPPPPSTPASTTPKPKPAPPTPETAAPGYGSGRAHAGVIPGAQSPQSVGAMAVPSGVRGTDVSSWNDPINWATVTGSGVKFAYIKATEGTYYTNSHYASDAASAKANGLYVGAYGFARPDSPDPAAQVNYLLAQANYYADGKTLPPMVDLEYGSAVGQQNCYGLSPAQLSAWIRAFVNEFQRVAGRPPVIYTATYWWNTCTGSDTSFGNLPLAIANYGSSPSPLPAGWGKYTLWQYTDNSGIPGAAGGIDGDVFNGSLADLATFASAGAVPAAAALSGSGLAATYHDGRFDVFGIRADGYLTQRTWEIGIGWGTWGTPIGGGFQGTPTATYTNGRYDIFAVGTDGAAYQQTWTSGAGWAPGSIPLGGGAFVG